MNLYYVRSLSGRVKIATLVLGLASASLMGFAYDRSTYNNQYKYDRLNRPNEGLAKFGVTLDKELYFLSVTIIFLLMSLSFFIHHLTNEDLTNCRQIQFLDVGFHALGALFILSAACLVIESTFAIDRVIKLDYHIGISLQYKNTKIIAGDTCNKNDHQCPPKIFFGGHWCSYFCFTNFVWNFVIYSVFQPALGVLNGIVYGFASFILGKCYAVLQKPM